ncbi:MAG: permease-like cell division protein FtsX [Melioribacteraceae bacterium]|nr:permease-like cell division protein FtsX [Melioribacteraceae bacterium]MCF8265185.1 permease-like cell division protein FtsX [Melioribacteraceae bacterium]MCF8413756.1 permease-like cell division protein FtsX [Melioribacteraceae bacterium]MCF8431132.1 permease-like cell division protein FtsX [Melioribacteraceae bacterium]
MKNYILREILRYFSNLKALTIITIVINSFTLAIIIVSAALYLNENKIIDQFKEDISLKLLLRNDLEQDAHKSVIKDLKVFDEVEGLAYKPKEKVEAEFIEQTGIDFREILDVNPLPANIDITIRSQFVQIGHLAEFKSKLLQLSQIDDVLIVNYEYLLIIEKYLNNRIYLYFVASLLFLISLVLNLMISKSVLKQKEIELETMKFVGATKNMMKSPIIAYEALVLLFSNFFVILIIYLSKSLLNSIGVSVNLESLIEIGIIMSLFFVLQLMLFNLNIKLNYFVKSEN